MLHVRALYNVVYLYDKWVGIATRYELDVQGIESQWKARFFAPVQTGPGAHPASYKMKTGSFLEGKAAGA